MSQDDLVEVFSTDRAPQAEILRLALQNEGIDCMVDGKSQGGFRGVGAFAVKLLVRADDFDRARKVIADFEETE